jgi:hypothetical protein
MTRFLLPLKKAQAAQVLASFLVESKGDAMKAYVMIKIRFEIQPVPGVEQTLTCLAVDV